MFFGVVLQSCDSGGLYIESVQLLGFSEGGNMLENLTHRSKLILVQLLHFLW